MSLRKTAEMSLGETAEMSLPDTTMQEQGYASGDVLVKPQWLLDHLQDPGLTVIEVDVGPVAFTKGHIEGAVLWNVYQDLKNANYEPAARQRSKRWSPGPESRRTRRWSSMATHLPWVSG